MIERDFIVRKTKEYYIQRYIESKLAKSGISSIKLKKIPLGEKIIINTSRPSLIVGSRGSNIRELTKELKAEFKLENPQIEINEIKDIYLDPAVVAEKIATYLERFGSARFKSIGHKIMENVIKSGALGLEIVISGKIPSSRAKSWRFYRGYLKKSGNASLEGVRRFKTRALLKSGVVGIKVSIMPPDFILPDRIELKEGVPEISFPEPEKGKVVGKEEKKGAREKKKEVKAGKEGKPKKRKPAAEPGPVTEPGPTAEPSPITEPKPVTESPASRPKPAKKLTKAAKIKVTEITGPLPEELPEKLSEKNERSPEETFPGETSSEETIPEKTDQPGPAGAEELSRLEEQPAAPEEESAAFADDKADEGALAGEAIARKETDDATNHDEANQKVSDNGNGNENENEKGNEK